MLFELNTGFEINTCKISELKLPFFNDVSNLLFTKKIVALINFMLSFFRKKGWVELKLIRH